MGIFKLFSSRIPPKPRNKDLQTNGSVNVSVQKNVGMRTGNASTVVNNISVTDNYKGRITISDLLLIPSSSVGANDLYLVYSSGSDEAGWSQGGTFTYEGETYSDGTFMQWMIDRWVAVDRDQTEEKQPTLFNPLQKIVSLISKTFAQSSYSNLPGRYKAGIPIAEIRNYELDEAGVYQEKKESQTGSQSAETNVKTLVVPYARSYTQGGEMVYEGGALDPADYEKLCKSDIEGMCKRIVVKSSKTFSVEELTGVGEILVKPSANMQVILPNDAVAIAGDRITISVIPANNTAGVDIATQTTTLFHNSSGYIATMSVTYVGGGWRLWGVQSTSI